MTTETRTKDLDKFKEGEVNDDVTNMKDNNYWLQNITSYQTQGGDKYSVLNYLTKSKSTYSKKIYRQLVKSI